MIATKTAELLGKLERQELDSMRQDLGRIDAEISTIEKSQKTARSDLGALMDRRGLDVPLDIASALSSGLRQQQENLAERMQQAEEARAAVNEVLMAKLLDVKRWEMVGEQSMTVDRAKISRDEQTMMDESAQNSRRRRLASKG